MGLLDSFLPNPQPGGLFSDPDSVLAIAAGLMGAKKGEGLAPLSQGVMQAMAAHRLNQTTERANRQNDLQQLTGAYSMLKQQEFGKMLAAKNAGQPYTPNPMLPQMEAKLAQLTGLGNLSANQPSSQQLPQQPAASLPAAQASQYSPVVQPGLRQTGPMPQPQAQQPDASGLGGPAGGLPMEAWLAMDSTGGKYMEQLAKDNAPIVLRQGDLVKKNADGTYGSAYQQPQMVPGVVPTRDKNGQATGARELPGFSGAAAGIKGAETGAVEGAKAPFRIEMVEQADGRKIPMFVPGIPGFGGTSAPSPASQNASPRVASLSVTQPSQNVAQSQTTPDDPWTTMPKRPASQGLGMSAYDARVTDVQGKNLDRLSEKLGGNADIAQKRMAVNNQSLEMVDRADTGPGAALIGDVKSILVSRFGIPEKDFTNDPAATVTLNKDLMNAAVARAKAMYGARMSTNEVNNMLKRGAPNGDMVKSAIKFLLQSDNTSASYDIQQASDFGKFVSKGGDPMQFESWYAKNFPLTAKESEVKLPKGDQAAQDALNVTDPDGNIHRFPSAQAAQAFRKRIGQ